MYYLPTSKKKSLTSYMACINGINATVVAWSLSIKDIGIMKAGVLSSFVSTNAISVHDTHNTPRKLRFGDNKFLIE